MFGVCWLDCVSGKQSEPAKQPVQTPADWETDMESEMNREDILEMADEAGATFVTKYGVASATPEWLERFAALIAAMEAQNWEAKCQQYIDIHDAVASDNDRLYALLARCETEMRYAGWGTPIADNAGRKDVYEDVVAYLRGEK